MTYKFTCDACLVQFTLNTSEDSVIDSPQFCPFCGEESLLDDLLDEFDDLEMDENGNDESLDD